jgi:dihydrofolate reductase
MYEQVLSPLEVIILVAMTRKGKVIGNKGKIPWSYPEDMEHFKQTTSGPDKILVMGRKTWDSLPVGKISGEKLAGRKKIVISRTPRPPQKDTIFMTSIDPSRVMSMARSLGARELYIIGGRSLYEDYTHVASMVLATMIEKEYPGDEIFPHREFETSFRSVMSTTIGPDQTLERYARIIHGTDETAFMDPLHHTDDFITVPTVAQRIIEIPDVRLVNTADAVNIIDNVITIVTPTGQVLRSGPTTLPG